MNFLLVEGDSEFTSRVFQVIGAQTPPAGTAYVLGVHLSNDKAREVVSGDHTKDSVLKFAARFVKQQQETA